MRYKPFTLGAEKVLVSPNLWTEIDLDRARIKGPGKGDAGALSGLTPLTPKRINSRFSFLDLRLAIFEFEAESPKARLKSDTPILDLVPFGGFDYSRRVV